MHLTSLQLKYINLRQSFIRSKLMDSTKDNKFSLSNLSAFGESEPHGNNEWINFLMLSFKDNHADIGIDPHSFQMRNLQEHETLDIQFESQAFHKILDSKKKLQHNQRNSNFDLEKLLIKCLKEGQTFQVATEEIKALKQKHNSAESEILNKGDQQESKQEEMKNPKQEEKKEYKLNCDSKQKQQQSEKQLSQEYFEEDSFQKPKEIQNSSYRMKNFLFQQKDYRQWLIYLVQQINFDNQTQVPNKYLKEILDTTDYKVKKAKCQLQNNKLLKKKFIQKLSKIRQCKNYQSNFNTKLQQILIKGLINGNKLKQVILLIEKMNEKRKQRTVHSVRFLWIMFLCKCINPQKVQFTKFAYNLCDFGTLQCFANDEGITIKYDERRVFFRFIDKLNLVLKKSNNVCLYYPQQKILLKAIKQKFQLAEVDRRINYQINKNSLRLSDYPQWIQFLCLNYPGNTRNIVFENSFRSQFIIDMVKMNNKSKELEKKWNFFQSKLENICKYYSAKQIDKAFLDPIEKKILKGYKKNYDFETVKSNISEESPKLQKEERKIDQKEKQQDAQNFKFPGKNLSKLVKVKIQNHLYEEKKEMYEQNTQEKLKPIYDRMIEKLEERYKAKTKQLELNFEFSELRYKAIIAQKTRRQNFLLNLIRQNEIKSKKLSRKIQKAPKVIEETTKQQEEQSREQKGDFSFSIPKMSNEKIPKLKNKSLEAYEEKILRGKSKLKKISSRLKNVR